MPLGFTVITALCLCAVVLLALVIAFSSGDTTRSMDDVYARRNTDEPRRDPTETSADQPASPTGRGRMTASASGGRSDPRPQQDAA